MQVLGVIPARGGSKSIPGKNLAPVAGRPLLAYTCDAAFRSARLTRTVLSTDDEAIASFGRASGLHVPFLRPPALAGDDTPMLETLRHTLTWLAENEDYRADVVVLLQPTSPLRRAEHIDAAVDLLLETGADSVVSVVEVPHQFNPVSAMRLQEGRLVPFLPGEMPLRRQDKPVLYGRNGPAVLAARRQTLMAQASLYGEQCVPYLMRPEDSVDIDTRFDLELAEWLLTRRAGRSTPGYESAHP